MGRPVVGAGCLWSHLIRHVWGWMWTVRVKLGHLGAGRGISIARMERPRALKSLSVSTPRWWLLALLSGDFLPYPLLSSDDSNDAGTDYMRRIHTDSPDAHSLMILMMKRLGSEIATCWIRCVFDVHFIFSGGQSRSFGSRIWVIWRTSLLMDQYSIDVGLNLNG
jgi:hypothetical protein